MYLGVGKVIKTNVYMNITFFFLLLNFYNPDISIYHLIVSFSVLVLYYLFDVYNLEKGKYRIEDFLNSLICNSILIVLGLKFHFFDNFKLIVVLNFIFQNTSKILFYYFCVKNNKILIIGKDRDSEDLKELIEAKDYYTVSSQITGKELNKIQDIILKKNISKIVITEEIENSEFAIMILNQKLHGIQVFDYLSFYEKLEEKVPIKSITEKWILFGSGYDILHRSFNIRVKRIFDVFCTFLIGLITLPIMVFSAIIVKLESKGPVLFQQSRIGLGNEPFKVYKFRSMRLHDEDEHSKYAQDNDDRITKFGNFMRKTRIDELPQLWNVLRGDMSFVGPRCEWDKLCKEYEKEIPFYNIRHSVKPGLTGWAQVRYPYGMGVEDALEKLTYDIYYIKHQNLAFDLMILFRTVKIVLFGRGR